MIAFIIIIIIVLTISGFVRAKMKDDDDLKGITAAEKFSILTTALNHSFFGNSAEVHTIDKNIFRLFDKETPNHLIEFDYSVGHLTIKWKVKHYMREMVHKKTISNVRNITADQQLAIAEQLEKEMEEIVPKFISDNDFI